MLTRFIPGQKLLLGLLLLLPVSSGWAQTTVQIPVQFDRWMYPFNGTPGARVVGSTFGALGETVFDDLDAQILLGFATSGQVDPSLASDPNFQLTSATVRLTTATDRAFALDASNDSLATYLDPATDTDTGRPVMLFGVGTRNGYQSLGLGAAVAGPPIFEETDSYGIPGPPAARVRHAYASDDGVRDISNFVRDSLEIKPWAVAQSASMAPSAEVPINSTLDFTIDLTLPAAQSQIMQGLQKGGVFFSVGSLHEATTGSSVGIPSFYLGDLNQNQMGQRASLELTYQVVPEPSAGLWGMGLLLAGISRFRRSG